MMLMSIDCGDGSVGKVPATQAWSRRFDTQYPREKLGATVPSCDPSPEEVATRESLGLPSQSVELNWCSSERPASKLRWEVIEEDSQCWPLRSSSMYICTNSNDKWVAGVTSYDPESQWSLIVALVPLSPGPFDWQQSNKDLKGWDRKDTHYIS